MYEENIFEEVPIRRVVVVLISHSFAEDEIKRSINKALDAEGILSIITRSTELFLLPNQTTFYSTFSDVGVIISSGVVANDSNGIYIF
jgi:hypothetical protein